MRALERKELQIVVISGQGRSCLYSIFHFRVTVRGVSGAPYRIYPGSNLGSVSVSDASLPSGYENKTKIK